MDKNLALETLKSFVEHPTDITVKDAILVLHPELAESKDERVRKALLHCCDDWEKGQFSCFSKEDVSAIRAYLEKQKEQKPAEWSDNFEENIRQLLHDKLTWHSEDGSMSSTVLIDDKTLKDIISGIWFYVGKEALKYPNKELNVIEWSEEDEIYLQDALWCVKQASKVAKGENDMGACWSAERWLKNRFKSLRPQPHWKPSEEQMNALYKAAEFFQENRYVCEPLLSLYEQLKKL